MKKVVATALFITCAALFGSGQFALAENTTDHEVKKGDTLWDLSESYLRDPLLWPKIWKINPDINDPHRIAPGQVIKIPLLDDKPGMEAPPVSAGETMAKPAPPAPKPAPVVEAPHEPLPIKVEAEQLPQIDPRQTALLDTGKYYDRGIGLVTRSIPNQGKVLNTPAGWGKTAIGETVLIKAPGAAIGQQFGVYRDLGEVKPLTYYGKSPGHLRADIAILEVVSSDALGQKAVIRRAFTEVRAGDTLGPVPVLPTVLENKYRGDAYPVKGEVVAVHLDRQLAGPDDIVYLNIGNSQGLELGDHLHVSSPDAQDNRRPGAELVVLRLTPTTAAALVLPNSAHEVRRGDVVGPIL